MRELAPLVDEHRRLEAAAAALDAVAGTAARPSAPARRGRPKGSGPRGAEALALVTSRPGITVGEIAATMGIKRNYLYRLLPSLADDGHVVKDGHGWRPAKAA